MKIASLFFIATLIFLTACTKQENVSQDVIQTEVARALEMTQAAYTSTPAFTATPTITKTPRPTSTPRPTYTPTPKPSFDDSPKTLEDMMIMGDQYTYNFPKITIYDVSTADKIGYSEPASGKIFALIRMKIENSGGIGNYGYPKFVAVGSNGVMVNPNSFTGIDCGLDYTVTVMDGATLDTCLVFEVSPGSNFTVMFAPYQNDPYNPERSLQWEIKLN